MNLYGAIIILFVFAIVWLAVERYRRLRDRRLRFAELEDRYDRLVQRWTALQELPADWPPALQGAVRGLQAQIARSLQGWIWVYRNLIPPSPWDQAQVNQLACGLNGQLEQLENQLEQEQIEQKKLAKELAVAEQKVTTLEEEVQQLTAELAERASVPENSSDSSKTKSSVCSTSAGCRRISSALTAVSISELFISVALNSPVDISTNATPARSPCTTTLPR